MSFRTKITGSGARKLRSHHRSQLDLVRRYDPKEIVESDIEERGPVRHIDRIEAATARQARRAQSGSLGGETELPEGELQRLREVQRRNERLLHSGYDGDDEAVPPSSGSAKEGKV